MLEKLHIYIAIAAALIVNVCCIAVSVPLYTGIYYIIAAIIVFYIIGIFVRNFIIKNFFNQEEKPNIENTDSAEVSESEGVEFSLDDEKKPV